MRAYEIDSPDGIDALHLAERDPPALGTGEVLVQLRASSLNYRGLLMVSDPAARGVRYPCIPNSDGAGEVLAIGDGVRRFQLGDRVAGCFFQRWSDGEIDGDGMASALGGALDGLLADQAVLREDGVVRIPDHLSFAAASTLPTLCRHPSRHAPGGGAGDSRSTAVTR